MKLYVFGDTHYAQLAAETCESDPMLTFSGFTVNRDFINHKTLQGYPVLAFEELAASEGRGEIAVFCAVGYRMMRLRQKIFDSVKALGFVLPNIVSASAMVASSACLGQNNIVMPGSVVEAGVNMGNNNVVWSNTTICHHSTIGDHNFFAANSTIGGDVTIGSLNFFGFGAIVEQARVIANENLIGAASYLNQSAESGGKWLGVPAKRIGANGDLGVQIDDPIHI